MNLETQANGRLVRVVSETAELVPTIDPDDDGTMSDSFSVLVTNPADLSMVISAIGETGVVDLDIEMTGMEPRTDRVRLLSLAGDTVDSSTAVYVIDAFTLLRFHRGISEM